ncbi:MAG: hypothetical protein ACQEP2_00750 [Actinomycetota bacterium]
MLIIFDSSTLFLLAKVDILQLVLKQYIGVIPEIVKKEVLFKETMDARIIKRFISEGKIKLNKNPNKKVIEKVCKDFPLGKGEAAALVLARKNNYIFATDDGLAIKVCKIFNIKFVTAIHFLIGAHIDKKIALAKLNLLQEFGRYSIDIIKDAKKRIIGG